MVRLPRHAPTPAAVVTYVGVCTFGLVYALANWYDDQEQATAGDWAWPSDPAAVLRSTAGWAVTVSLWCAVVWVASVRGSRAGHPWRGAVAAATVIGTWTLLAWRSFLVNFEVNGWYVPWPGPVPGLEYLNPHDPLGDPPLALRPGIGTPIALIGAVLVVAVLARRHAARHPVPPRSSPSRDAWRTALVVLVPPACAALIAATMLQLPSDDAGTPLRQFLWCLEYPGFGLTLAVAAAVLLGGTGRGSWGLLGLVHLSVVGPAVRLWALGGDDDLLATAALGTVAVALAAAVRPVATALARLDQVVEPASESVPEGADADDRARA